MNLCFLLFWQKRREGRKNSNKRDTGKEKKMVNPLILFLKEDREKKREKKRHRAKEKDGQASVSIFKGR